MGTSIGTSVPVGSVSVGADALYSGIFDEAVGASMDVGIGIGVPGDPNIVAGTTATQFKTNIPPNIENAKTWITNI